MPSNVLFFYQVTGIYRAMTVRVGPTQRTVKSLFKVCAKCSYLIYTYYAV